MKPAIAVAVLCLLMVWGASAQEFPEKDFPAQLPAGKAGPAKTPSRDNTPPRSPDAGESSSKDTKIDLSRPEADIKAHPERDDRNVSPSYDPHKAAKSLEIGNFYAHRGNYQAALSRYQEALRWKPDDAEATFRAAQMLQRLDRPQEARANYEAYLKLLPEGPHAKESRKGLEKLAEQAKRTN